MQTTSPYKTAAELGITEEVRRGLVDLARDLSDGTIPPERFYMGSWCGTACCFAGHLERRGVIRISEGFSRSLTRLFMPDEPAISCHDPLRGARAVVNFLTLGDSKWDSVMASGD